jgi:hypothetical protein
VVLRPHRTFGFLCDDPIRVAVAHPDCRVNELLWRYERTGTLRTQATKKAVDKDPKFLLRQCFEFFAAHDILDTHNQWFCPNCRQFVCAEKKMDIWRVPEILVLQACGISTLCDCHTHPMMVAALGKWMQERTLIRWQSRMLTSKTKTRENERQGSRRVDER